MVHITGCLWNRVPFSNAQLMQFWDDSDITDYYPCLGGVPRSGMDNLSSAFAGLKEGEISLYSCRVLQLKHIEAKVVEYARVESTARS